MSPDRPTGRDSEDTAHWEHFAHAADIGVRGVGATLEQAFEQAALALTAVIVDPTAVAPKETFWLSCVAPDPELLLVDWLNTLIYEMVTRNMLFSRFEVQVAGERLEAQVWGEALDVARHHPAVEVKGATYTALKVARQPDGNWLAQCVVDV
jgi:tRNA nucleotidyltransferase (CCA-adding enzyme)